MKKETSFYPPKFELENLSDYVFQLQTISPAWT